MLDDRCQRSNLSSCLSRHSHAESPRHSRAGGDDGFLYFGFLLILTFLLLFSSPTRAFISDPITTDQNSVRLLVGNQSDNKIELGIEFKLQPGWKVYWRTPGDVGMPITANWQGSENLSNPQIIWPAPKRFNEYDIESFGYHDYLLLPIKAETTPGRPVTINLHLSYAICKEICIIEEHDFHTMIQAGAKDDQANNLIAQAETLVPGNNAGISIVDSSLKKSGKDAEIIVKAVSRSALQEPDLIVEGPADFRFVKGAVKFSADKKEAVFTIPVISQISDKNFTGGNLTLTLVDGKYSLEKKITLGPKTKHKKTDSAEFGLIIILAFIGGLILNLMPCVLPVLSIKLLGILKQGGKSKAHVRSAFLSSTAGILFSFLFLAAIISLLKKLGMAVGWGFHFQEPLFIIFLFVILLIFSANLFGLFEINIPRWLDRFVNKRHHEENEKFSHFMSGALATLLATPCSAPFLGTAISFALSQGTIEIFVIFYFIGAGLAAPYIIFAFFPSLVAKLPRPGKWMVKVKYIMGLLLVATIIWLLLILSAQLGMDAAAGIGFSALFFYLIFFFTKRTHAKTRYLVRLLTILLVIIVAGYFALFPNIAANKNADGFWQEFKRDRISEEVAAGNIVLVDVTANWCLTCKANELRVFDKSDVREELIRQKIVPLRADWTNRNPAIRDYLESHHRFGIPFNVVYGPHAPQGIALSELLSKAELLQAIDKAR